VQERHKYINTRANTKITHRLQSHPVALHCWLALNRSTQCQSL